MGLYASPPPNIIQGLYPLTFQDWHASTQGPLVSPLMVFKAAKSAKEELNKTFGLNDNPYKCVLQQDSLGRYRLAIYVSSIANLIITAPHSDQAHAVPATQISAEKLPLNNEEVSAYNKRHLNLSPEQLKAKFQKEFNAAQQHLHESQNNDWNFKFEKSCKTGFQTFETSELTSELSTEHAEVLGEVGVANTQGDRRKNMEDRFLATVLEIVVKEKNLLIPLYAVFDGHGGAECAQYLKEHLSDYLKEHLTSALNKTSSDAAELAVFNILKTAFVHLGEVFNKDHPNRTGSTATVVLKIDSDLWVANVGDSRAILCQNGIAIALSEDAKPSLAKYEKGVIRRGGFLHKYLNKTIRVAGFLAIARSVGHHPATGINPRAKIIKFSMDELTTKHAIHLVIGSDGLWDVASSNQTAEAIKEYLSGLQTITSLPYELALNLVQRAFGANSRDNITTLVAQLYCDRHEKSIFTTQKATG